jgi:hypothetical protein
MLRLIGIAAALTGGDELQPPVRKKLVAAGTMEEMGKKS